MQVRAEGLRGTDKAAGSQCDRRHRQPAPEAHRAARRAAHDRGHGPSPSPRRPTATGPHWSTGFDGLEGL